MALLTVIFQLENVCCLVRASGELKGLVPDCMQEESGQVCNCEDVQVALSCYRADG